MKLLFLALLVVVTVIFGLHLTSLNLNDQEDNEVLADLPKTSPTLSATDSPTPVPSPSPALTTSPTAALTTSPSTAVTSSPTAAVTSSPSTTLASSSTPAPSPSATPTSSPLPGPGQKVLSVGCYDSHREGDTWPELVYGVEGTVRCSQNQYIFKPRFSFPLESPRPAPNPLANTIVTFYGNRAAGSMGIIGEYSLEQLETRLKSLAAIYDELNGTPGVTMAFDYIYLVANGSVKPYAHYTPNPDLFDEALAFAEKRGMLFFIDLQLGYRDIKEEVEKVLPYLKKPNVHLAVDTEFYMGRKGGIPGDTVGQMDAADINLIQGLMQRYIQENNLPDKILKVYQFDPSMLLNKDKLNVDAPYVKILINADGVGFGGVDGKIGDYQEYAEEKHDALGIKLFYKWDARLLSPEELMALVPPPNEIVYQ